MALRMKRQDIGERHGFSVEVALDIATLRVAEEFDLLGGLDAFAHGFIAEFMAKREQVGQEDARLALLGSEFGQKCLVEFYDIHRKLNEMP